MESSTVGTILEMRAVTWLLSHGFRVWRALDGGQTGDLVIATRSGLVEVEVRAGKRRKKRNGVYFRRYRQDTAELYLVMIPNEQGVYWRAAGEAPARYTLVQAHPVVPRCEAED